MTAPQTGKARTASLPTLHPYAIKPNSQAPLHPPQPRCKARRHRSFSWGHGVTNSLAVAYHHSLIAMSKQLNCTFLHNFVLAGGLPLPLCACWQGRASQGIRWKQQLNDQQFGLDPHTDNIIAFLIFWLSCFEWKFSQYC